MDTGVLALFIPIIAIVMGIGSAMLKMWTRHEQEMARIRASQGVEMNQTIQKQFDDMRNEIFQLRDTTTKYDLSVEQSMQELGRRITAVEGKEPSASAFERVDDKTTERHAQLQQESPSVNRISNR
jgi:TolA-binding protein